MKLIVIIVCLLSERFLIHGWSYERFSWFADYCKRISQLGEKHNYFSNPWILFAAIVLPLVVIAGLIYALFHSVLFGFFGLILSILIIFYCLGPHNAFYPLSEAEAEDNDQLIGHYFAQVNSQLFAIIFWYVLAGPIAALAYRLISLSCAIQEVKQQAIEVSEILEWIPARLTALLYLLVGNFQRGLSLFVKYFFASPNLNNKMLYDCGLQVVRTTEDETVPMPVAESLVEHAVIVLLVFIALFTLVAWM